MWDLVCVLLILGTALLALHSFKPRDKWGINSHKDEE